MYEAAFSRGAPYVVITAFCIFFLFNPKVALAKAVPRFSQGPVSGFKAPCNDAALI